MTAVPISRTSQPRTTTPPPSSGPAIGRLMRPRPITATGAVYLDAPSPKSQPGRMQCQPRAGHRQCFYLALGDLGYEQRHPVEREGTVGRLRPVQHQTLRDLTVAIKHGDIALVVNGAIEPSVGAELHAIRPAKHRSVIRLQHIAEELALRRSRAEHVVTIDLAGERGICIEVIVGVEGNAVGKADAAVNSPHNAAGFGIEFIHAPIPG